MPRLTPVILSGGAGTRLWPLSRVGRPKQFLPLVTERTLLQETLLRTKALEESVRAPIVVCRDEHRFLVAEQLREIGAVPDAIVLEPQGRNTAPALAIAALLAAEPGLGRPHRAAASQGDDPLLLVLPADHVILDTDAFGAAVTVGAAAAASGRLMTFGVVPTGPETGYGYLLCGDSRDGWNELAEFVEKPNLETAIRYVESGRYLWNSGMFVCSARVYLDELGRHAPKMLAACREALAGASADTDFVRLAPSFAACPSDSIDYAVMEKTDKAGVVPLDAGWSDVGSWTSLHELLPKDDHGNAVVGDVLAQGCRDSYVSSTSRLVVALGLDGIVVVETADAVLVVAKKDAQHVKGVIDRLKQLKRGEAT